MDTKAIETFEKEVTNARGKTFIVNPCIHCSGVKRGEISVPHQHTVDCSNCGKIEKCTVISTMHEYHPPELVSLPPGWFLAVDSDANHEYALCSPECVKAMYSLAKE